MAVKLLSLLLLWNLTFLIQDVTSFCTVTCTTDYEKSLNCSCSGSVPTFPILLEAKCRDFEMEVNGSCEINPPQSWCLIYPEEFYLIASIGTTTCTASVQQDNQVKVNVNESSSWVLSDMVKPLEPSDVQVKTGSEFFNITWDINNHLDDCLSYRVRIRASGDLSKDPVNPLSVDQKYVLIHRTKLQPCTKYTVDVQALLCPDAKYKGPGSEWSPTTEWNTMGTYAKTECPGNDAHWWYLFLLMIPVLGLLVLGYSQKPYWLKKLQLITYIPKPNEFFEPLYHTYEGNFKEWVRPVFSEYDVLMINTPIGGQHDVFHWNMEKQSCGKDETKQGGCSHHSFQPHSASLLHFHEGGSLHGTGHSTGHISIHTVTLSGEEEFEAETVSRSSINTLRSYQDGESFGSYAGDNRERAGYDLGEPQMSRMFREGGLLGQDGNQMSNHLSVSNMNCQPRAHIMEPERVSLDSFASNEQSEDGYPSVDLDTIDSGFGEADCSSPVTSESNTAEQIDSDLFHEGGNSNSNYVKQWMICSTLQEDPSDSANTLPKTL
ncbi:uncharacterized protein LOC139917928 [Centroberyx gerrardi]